MKLSKRMALVAFIMSAGIVNAMEKPSVQSSQAVNTMTDMVQAITKRVKYLRDRTITIDPETPS